MKMTDGFYHKLLRISIVVLALVLVFDSGIIYEETKYLSDLAQGHVASVVGVTVGVAPNELNQLTTRITELEGELAAKERLIAVNIRDNSEDNLVDWSTLILSIILFILLTLILLNYYLDFTRGRRQVPVNGLASNV
jgi:hypothetical protein